jgi:hypothetical protein
MKPLTHDDLYTLEAYAGERADFRARVLAHKQARKVHLGEHVTLLFEDRLTIQYQIQEMLRVERIFEAAGITDELDAYNPLIPDGANLKATMLIEYGDPDVRKRELAKLRNIEDRIHLEVEGAGRTTAIADEDLERSNEEKTSAVHFLRLELTPEMIAAWKNGAAVRLSCDHENYVAGTLLDDTQNQALMADFD